MMNSFEYAFNLFQSHDWCLKDFQRESFLLPSSPRENTEGKERSHNGRQHKMTDKMNDNINMYITGHFHDVIVYHMLSHASL
jgi:hypothetical protein